MAFGELANAPLDLPANVNDPLDAERWLGWLAKQWKDVPGVYDAIAEAMDQNRSRNAAFFQGRGSI
jgi:hypothetical protein